MAPPSIGNDIVDLQAEGSPLHPRYKERVFTRTEQERIGHNLPALWVNWAAKEAAYKMVKRHHSIMYFAPKEFEYDSLTDSVEYNSVTYPCISSFDENHATSICASNQEILKSPLLHSWVTKLSSNSKSSSEEIREVAILKISTLLKISEENLSISPSREKGSPPILFIDGSPSTYLLSFSHHGGLLFCSCYLGGVE